eukprot:COSAG02_NODE_3611_length_6484_cov_172.449178_2_plen_98_part_00
MLMGGQLDTLSLGGLFLQIPALGTMIVNQLVAAGVQPAGSDAVATERALASLAQCSKKLHRDVAGALRVRRSLHKIVTRPSDYFVVATLRKKRYSIT